MKHKLLKLKALLVVLMMAVGFGQAMAEDVTYSVTSKTTVSTGGTAPTGSSATFSQTYNTPMQMTSGNSMTLTLSGYAGQKITAIKLSMKSNTSKGAGYLSVTAGTTTLATIGSSNSGVAFNNSAWNGAYTTSYVDVTPTMSNSTYDIGNGENVVITIGATQNSLYCESFTITYEAGSGGGDTPTTHTLTYSATNGSIGGVVYGTSTPVESGASVAEGDKVTLTAQPADGYQFDSWSIEGTGSSMSSTSTNPTDFTMGTADATVTANFTATGGTTTYSVTYDGNGATSGSVPTDATAYSPNATVTVLGNTGSLVKTGHAFSGWNTQANGEGTTYAASETFNITGNTTLYAKWTPYTITAQSNNNTYGTVTLSNFVITGSPAPGYRYADPAYTVSPENSATVVQNGNAFTVTPSANTTVTINFEAIPTYTVTLSDDTENPITENTPGAGVTLPSRSAIGSYTFDGWSETNVSEETTTAPTIIPAGIYYPTANITLYPVYSNSIGGGGTSHEKTSVTISEYADTNAWGSSSSANQKNITLNSDVTAICNSGTNSGKYYNDGWRIYQTESGKVTVSTKSGELTSVTLTFTRNNGGTLNYNSSAITSGTAVDVSGTSAEFTVGNSGSATNGQVRISAISVNYDVTGAGTTYYWSAPVAATVEMPNIVVAENPFFFSTTATITCATEGAAIKYSYDGETWNDYEEPLVITEAKTIYAKAIKDENESSVAQVTATKNLATPTVTINVPDGFTNDLANETEVAAGTLTASVTYNEAAVASASVTWESTNTDVATVNATTGAVTLIAQGMAKIKANYAGNSDYAAANAEYDLTVIDSYEKGQQNNPYTVAEVINGTATGSDIYVVGYIVGEYVGNSTNPRTSGFTTNASFAIAEEFTSSPTASGSIPVQLPTDPLKNAWGNQTNNGTTIGYKVIVKGNKDTYFNVNGIKSTSAVEAISVRTVVSTSSYATFAANADLDFTDSNIKAYIAKAKDDGSGVTFERKYKIPAGTGVLLYKDGGAEEEIPVTTESTEDVINNVFVRGEGVAVASVVGNMYNYILNKVNNVVGFYKAAGNKVAKNRAYIQVESASFAKDFISMPGFDDSTTGVNEVNGSGLMVNGPVYDLQGRRVEKPGKGLYIVNGKKVLKY